jgi:hypothetical protein
MEARMKAPIEWRGCPQTAGHKTSRTPAPPRRTWLQASLLAAVSVQGLMPGLAALVAPQVHAQPARTERLAQAEAALARGDAALALRLYEAESEREHASDIEQGIVRCLMQAGETRRALAFAAHTAGAHGREVGGSVLYAWLLSLTGQTPHALKVLEEASARGPDEVGVDLVGLVRQQLLSEQGAADPRLLAWPHRLAPHAWSANPASAPPAHVRVVAGGLLLDNGRQALVPAAAASDDEPLWLRNGLGQAALVGPARQPLTSELTLLTLAAPMHAPRSVPWVGRDAFPGSPLLVCDYALRDVAAESRSAAWPRLRQGFLGTPTAADQAWPLGLTLAGRQAGGPVFDLGGRVIGVSATEMRAGTWHSQLVPTSRFRGALGPADAPAAASTHAAARMRFDEIHEMAMGFTLELLRPVRAPA